MAVPRFSSPVRQDSLGGGAAQFDPTAVVAVVVEVAQTFFLLQAFLPAETNGGLLPDGFSVFISLPKVSDPGTLGGWSCSTSSVDLSH